MSRWPLHKAYFWERFPFFRILLPFVAGILCYEYLQGHIVLTVVIGISVLSAIVFTTTFLLKRKSTALNLLAFVTANLFLLSAAWLTAYTYDARNDKQWLGNTVENAESCAVTITETPAEKARTWKVPVSITHSIHNSVASPATGKALLYIYKGKWPLRYRVGDKLILPNKWQRIKNARNPFEFDYAQYAARSNIYYQQFSAQKDITRYHIAHTLPWWVQLHEWAMHKLEQYITDRQTLGLLQAMLVGDKTNMDEDLRQAYAETGIVHIIAISGSHIGIFFIMVTFLLGWIRNKKYHWLKYMLAIPLIWTYVLVAGLPPSAVRAACMFSLLGIGFAFQRQHNSINQLLVTAFILLLAQPYWLFAVGFQLSFLAVLSILLFYPPVYKLWRPKYKLLRGIWAAIAVSIAAEILVAPLVVYYFHLFPLMFLIANVAAYLFMGVVLISGMLLIACSSIPFLATFLATCITWLTVFFNQLVQVFRTWNPEALNTLVLTGFGLLCIYTITITLSIYISSKKKPVLFIMLICFCVWIVYSINREYSILQQQYLIVYNISRLNHIELVQGHTYAVIATDTAYPAPKKNYTLKPAHIGFRSLEKIELPQQELLHIGNATVLILSSAQQLLIPAPADYVIINYKASPADMEAIKASCNPRMVVIGNNITRRKQKAMEEAANTIGLPLHIVGRDGAFVLSNM